MIVVVFMYSLHYKRISVNQNCLMWPVQMFRCFYKGSKYPIRDESVLFYFPHLGPPVNVTCNIFINSFGSITETTMVRIASDFMNTLVWLADSQLTMVKPVDKQVGVR